MVWRRGQYPSKAQYETRCCRSRGVRLRPSSFLALVALTGSLLSFAAAPMDAVAAEQSYSRGGEFVPLAPTRIVDTRTGLGSGSAAPRSGRSVLTFDVAGRAGIPAEKVHAAVLNVTVIGAGASGYAVVYPCCYKAPTASTHNFGPSEVVANQVVTAVGPKGRARIYVSGTAHVIVDVAGYYTDIGSEVIGDRLRPTSPVRLLDTRIGLGAARKQVSKHGEIRLAVSGRGPVPRNATAVVMNVTATNVAESTFVTAFPYGMTRPNASNLNLVAGDTRANLVTVKLGEGGAIGLYNHVGTVDLLADVVGYYTKATDPKADAGRVVAFHPARVLDTRSRQQPVFAGSTVSVDTGFLTSVVGFQPAGAFINITASEVTAETFATLYPRRLPKRPNASTLNASPGQIVPNLSMVSLRGAGPVGFTIYNHQGQAHMIADLVAIVL